MTNPKHTDTSRSDLVERLRGDKYTCRENMGCGTMEFCACATMEDAAAHIQALEAENERLRGVLEAVWKEATTMRNASKLVGPYPKEPASNRVWARSMYHAGRKLHALIKPVRAALGEK